MSSYVDKYSSLFAQLESMGKDIAIPESHKAPMLLASIDPKCPLESTAAALRTKDASELTWEYVATTLIDEYNAREASSSGSKKLGKSRSKRNGKNNRSNSSKSNDLSHDGSDSDEDSGIHAVKTLAMALSSNTSYCTLCEKTGHTEPKCFQNPENPNNKLPQKIRDMYAAFIAQAKQGEKDKPKGKSDRKSVV